MTSNPSTSGLISSPVPMKSNTTIITTTTSSSTSTSATTQVMSSPVSPSQGGGADRFTFTNVFGDPTAESDRRSCLLNAFENDIGIHKVEGGSPEQCEIVDGMMIKRNLAHKVG